MSVEELGKTIGSNIQDKNAMKSELITPSSTPHSNMLFGNYKLRVRGTRCLIERRSIGTAFILGHVSRAILGTTELGAGTQGSWTEIQDIRTEQNIPTEAKLQIAKWFASETVSNPSYVSIGTSDTAYSENDVSLGTEKFRKAGTISTDTNEVSYQIEVKSTDDVVIGNTIKEVGVTLDGSNTSTITGTGGKELDITLGTHS